MNSNQYSQDQLSQDPPTVPTLSTEERMNMFEQSLMAMNTNMNRLLTLFEAQVPWRQAPHLLLLRCLLQFRLRNLRLL